MALVATVIGQDFSDGKIVINPRLVGYLERKGVYQPRENPTGLQTRRCTRRLRAALSRAPRASRVPRVSGRR